MGRMALPTQPDAAAGLPRRATLWIMNRDNPLDAVVVHPVT
jgi:hypothetical protein